MNETQRKLLQLVFDSFKENYKWPNSRRIQVDFRQFGDSWEIAEEIGRHLIWMSEKHVHNGQAHLSIEGIACCEGSEKITTLFIQTLKYFVNAYISDPENRKVTSIDLKQELKINDEQCSLAYSFLSREAGISSGSSLEKDQNMYEFTVSPDILNFNKINTIDDYIKLRQKTRLEYNNFQDTSSLYKYYLPSEVFQIISDNIENNLPLLISDEKLRLIVSQDLSEIKKAFQTESWKTICILCGSVCEAILSDILDNLDFLPNKNRLSLKDLIHIAVKNKIVPRRDENLLGYIRETRNLIHPNLAKVDGVVDRSTAEASFKLFEVLVHSIIKNRTR